MMRTLRITLVLVKLGFSLFFLLHYISYQCLIFPFVTANEQHLFFLNEKSPHDVSSSVTEIQLKEEIHFSGRIS